MKLYLNIAQRLTQFNQMVHHLNTCDTPILTVGLSLSRQIYDIFDSIMSTIRALTAGIETTDFGFNR